MGHGNRQVDIVTQLPLTNTVVDNTNGTVTINQNAGGVESSIKPVSELPILSDSLDITSDRFLVYDSSTGNHVYVTASIINAPEVFRSNLPLTGIAPTPYKVGINYSTGIQYYVDASGNWQAFPVGTTVVLTDLANGNLSINAGLGGIQESQRPILELPILPRNLIDIVSDYDDVWDASAGIMVRVLATRASQLAYKASGLNDTRAGDIGSITSSIFAVHDHVHPITAIVTPPATPVIVGGGTGLVITSQSLVRVLTEEESVTYHILVNVTQTASNAWNTLTVPSIAGYKIPTTVVTSTYRSSGNPNLAAGWQNAPSMAIEASNYNMTNVIYLNCANRTQATAIQISLSIKYILA